VSMATLALAWVLAHPDVTAVVLGPRRPEHLEPARDALELRLSDAERDELTELFA
jgi:aryl-alcohol dehydrogenase-like predicted oxidoreductase